MTRYDPKTLPKWAQDKINGLTLEVERLQKRIAILSEPGETNTAHNIYGPIWDGTPLLYLPDYTRIRFQLLNCAFVVGIDKPSGKLEITSTQNILLEFRGTGQLSLSAEQK